MRHEGSIAIVTDAAQGIGKACIRRLFEEGASVMLADIQETRDRDVPHTLDPSDVRATARRCEVVRLVDGTVRRCSRLQCTSALELTAEELDRILDVNLKGTFWGTQEAVKVMVAHGTHRACPSQPHGPGS